MLEPEARSLLLDALRPPAGQRLDLAVGTTYSLDLVALMAAPVAFAMFDRESSDGSLREDPVAALQALREYAGKITLFCQAGQIAVPIDFRSLFVYLEQTIYPVVPPRSTAIFHPKVWLIRYRGDGGVLSYRLLCLSRNLTFDRSWDTLLRLEGDPSGQTSSPELAAFVNGLLQMANRVHPVPHERAEAIRQLGDELTSVHWVLPDMFREVRFWPLGHDGAERWPFSGRLDSLLCVSPFVTSQMLRRLTNRRTGSILLSRPETFEELGGRAVADLGERLVLSGDAVGTPSGGEEPATEDAPTETLAEAAGNRLDGLHAKLYVADAGWNARVWTGSANATDAAFNGNVEFLVELSGSKDRCGIRATIGDDATKLGLRKLVEAYEPVSVEPQELTESERLEQLVDRIRRAIGGLRFTARCRALADSRWQLALDAVAEATRIENDVAHVDVTIRPVTLGAGAAVSVEAAPTGLTASFEVSEPAVTPYFVVELAAGELDPVRFLIAAELVDAPPGRREHVLADILSNPAELLRFLALLLGDLNVAFGLQGGDPGMEWTGTWTGASIGGPLLEPMVRAFARDRDRLHDIARLIADLESAGTAASVLPQGWADIWLPIAAALAEGKAT